MGREDRDTSDGDRMTEDQKHQLAAQMCLTWRHDYDLQRDPDDPLSSGTTQVERMYLHSKMMQLIEHHWPKERMASAVEAEVLRRQAAEVEALRADAARYRWLRDAHPATEEIVVVRWREPMQDMRYEILDAAIDAALRAAETNE